MLSMDYLELEASGRSWWEPSGAVEGTGWLSQMSKCFRCNERQLVQVRLQQVHFQFE